MVSEERKNRFIQYMEQKEFSKDEEGGENYEARRLKRGGESIKRLERDRAFGGGLEHGIKGTDISWDIIRKHYVVGDRKQLEDGTWVSNDISLRELGKIYGLNYQIIAKRSKQEQWVKLREAYLARVNERNIGLELNFYTQENFANEVSAMNAANKLGKVLETYIETKYSRILEAHESLDDKEIEKDEEIQREFNRVNNNTGMSVFINELQNAVKVADSIYTLQRKIYDNAPNDDNTVVEEILKKPKFRNDKERENKLNQLKQRLLSNTNINTNTISSSTDTEEILDIESIEINT